MRQAPRVAVRRRHRPRRRRRRRRVPVPRAVFRRHRGVPQVDAAGGRGDPDLRVRTHALGETTGRRHHRRRRRRRADDIREADVYEGANRYRARFLRAKLFDDEENLGGVETERNRVGRARVTAGALSFRPQCGGNGQRTLSVSTSVMSPAIRAVKPPVATPVRQVFEEGSSRSTVSAVA